MNNILTGFVNKGTDELILKSIPTEGITEDLEKALKKEGLVQKQITVQGKHGQYTKMAWVKAGDKVSDSKMKMVPPNNDPGMRKFSKREDYDKWVGSIKTEVSQHEGEYSDSEVKAMAKKYKTSEKDMKNQIHMAKQESKMNSKDSEKTETSKEEKIKELWDKAVNASSNSGDVVSIAGCDYDTVQELAQEDEDIAAAIDEYPEGLSTLVYNQGTKDDPYICIASYASNDQSFDSFEEFADFVENNEIITDKEQIKRIIQEEYMD